MFQARFLFFAFFLFSLSNVTSCLTHKQYPIPPKVVAGKIDLSNWDFSGNGPVDLSGEYEFYWNQFIPLEDVTKYAGNCDFITVPGDWKATDVPPTIKGTGYATYRILINLPGRNRELALKLPDISTAYALYINGNEAFRTGRAGVSKEASAPGLLSAIIEIPPGSNRIELVFHVSNFFHARGGIGEIIKIGTPEQLRRVRENRVALDLVLFGAILIMGFYHVVISNFRQRERSFLFFGLFCLLISTRLLTTDENYLLYFFPNLNWEIFLKIEYLTYYLSVPVFALFLDNVFPEGFPKFVIKGILIFGFIFSGLILFTPALFFTSTLPAYQLFTVIVILYAITMLVAWSLQKVEGAQSILAGFLFLAVAVINDILDANDVIHTGHYVHYGVFLFIFSQAALLSYKFSKAFNIIESQRQELIIANEKYKTELNERTKAEKANKELQEKLNRAQKMEAIGLLAGGVAHDLNNILAGTVTYPDLLLSELPESSPFYKPLETIKSAGLKAAAVVQDLLTLARRVVVNFETLNINTLVKEYLGSPEFQQLKLAHATVDVQAELEPKLCNIKGSPVHLKKTIMNLVNNAAEAQPKGGLIFISTQNYYVDTTLKGDEDIPEGNYVTLTVKDHGIGIEPVDLKKIFEPFYTKKIMGRSGTGLGMSVVWGTVHDHGGYINIKSEIDTGTEFELYFPITHDELTQQRLPVSLETLKGQNQSILVIDDIPEQREIAIHILTRLGYSAASVASGEEAEQYLQKRSADLVLLDMIMEPGIDGLETYQRILKYHPNQKAIIASGFSETSRVKTAIALGVGRYIKKPYTIENLGQAVKEELQKSPVHALKK